MNTFMIATELYIMNTQVEESDEEGMEAMVIMEFTVQKLDAWINGVCYGDLVTAAEAGMLEITAEEAEQAWIDMTEKQGVNNDGSNCVDQSKLFTEPPLLAATGSDPTIGGSPEADLMTDSGRRLKYKAKA